MARRKRVKAAKAPVKRVEALEAVNLSSSEEDMATLAEVKATERKRISRQDMWIASKFYEEQANTQLDDWARCQRKLIGISCS